MKRSCLTQLVLFLIFSLAVPLLLSADWQTPINMGWWINGPEEDYSPFITRDGAHLYYAKGPVSNRDLYVSEFRSGQWQPPMWLGPFINSSYDDRDPTVVGDTMIIFASDRPSPYTGWPFHLWFSKKDSTGNWMTAQLVGDPIGSNYGDETPWMMCEGPDTLLLLFCSDNRPGGQGDWDIWQARKVGGVWQTPTNVGPPVNTSSGESSPNIWVSYLDGLDSIRMYFCTSFGGYYADRVDGVWRNPVRLTNIINNGGMDRPSISFDNQTLYFTSSRPGGYGQRDIWYSTNSSGVESEEKKQPAFSSALRLTALPNPFQARSVIMFSLDREEAIDLDIYGLDGHLVRSLFSGKHPPGVHQMTWDGRDDRGLSVGPGAYFLRLRTPDTSLTARLLKLN